MGRGPNGIVERQDVWSATDLLDAVFPDPVWVVPRLLTTGLGVLAGKPKVGKSWLALQLAGAVGSGGQFWNERLERGSVLFYALEDNPARIQKRMRSQRWGRDGGVEFRFSLTGGLQGVADEIARRAPRLTVVDTLSRAWRVMRANDIREVTDALDSLQEAALSLNCCVLLIDHMRKTNAALLPGGEGDWIDDIVNSLAKAAVADTVWGLYRTNVKHTATLRTRGRDLPDDVALRLEFDPNLCLWRYMGEPENLHQAGQKQRIVAAMAQCGGSATTTNLSQVLGLHKSNVSALLGELVNSGLVGEGKKQGKEKPYFLV